MKLTQVATLPLFFSVVLAAPTKTFPLQARSTTLTESFASVVTGAYTVYQNLWGEADATSGSQTLTLDSESDGTVVWSTSWTWAGGKYDVKSYDNIALTTTGKKISSISSIPTIYHWSYSGSSIVADVSYDLFTASSASGTNEFEIMVWLAALGGAGPISSSGSSIGSTTVGGTTFDLYSGPNGDTTVYSFVATSEAKSFSGDLLEFFTYLIDHEGFSSSQYITTLEAGTEPFTGSDAVLSVSAYSVSIKASDSTSACSTTVPPISSLQLLLLHQPLRPCKIKSTKSAVATTPSGSSLLAVATHSAPSTKLAASATPTTFFSTSVQPSITSHFTH